MEPELALLCYNVKIAPLTSETGKDAFGRWVACDLQGGIFSLIPQSGVQFCPIAIHFLELLQR